MLALQVPQHTGVCSMGGFRGERARLWGCKGGIIPGLLGGCGGWRHRLGDIRGSRVGWTIGRRRAGRPSPLGAAFPGRFTGVFLALADAVAAGDSARTAFLVEMTGGAGRIGLQAGSLAGGSLVPRHRSGSGDSGQDDRTEVI